MTCNGIHIYSIILLGIISPIALFTSKQPFSEVEKTQKPKKISTRCPVSTLDDLYQHDELLDITRTVLLKNYYFILKNQLSDNEKMFKTIFEHLKNETIRYFCRYIYYTQKKQFLDIIETPKTFDAINMIGNTSLNLDSLADEHINVFLPYILDLITIISPDIRFLWLSRNELKEIPAQIGNLKKLEWIDASNNKLTRLPEELGNCTFLKVLWLENNDLTDLPLSILKLKNLDDIDFENNKLIPDLMHNFKNPFLIS